MSARLRTAPGKYTQECLPLPALLLWDRVSGNGAPVKVKHDNLATAADDIIPLLFVMQEHDVPQVKIPMQQAWRNGIDTV
jgi:hypothetical protein